MRDKIHRRGGGGNEGKDWRRKSGMRGDVQVWFRERLEGKFLGATPLFREPRRSTGYYYRA